MQANVKVLVVQNGPLENVYYHVPCMFITCINALILQRADVTPDFPASDPEPQQIIQLVSTGSGQDIFKLRNRIVYLIFQFLTAG